MRHVQTYRATKVRQHDDEVHSVHEERHALPQQEIVLREFLLPILPKACGDLWLSVLGWRRLLLNMPSIVVSLLRSYRVFGAKVACIKKWATSFRQPFLHLYETCQTFLRVTSKWLSPLTKSILFRVYVLHITLPHHF